MGSRLSVGLGVGTPNPQRRVWEWIGPNWAFSVNPIPQRISGEIEFDYSRIRIFRTIRRVACWVHGIQTGWVRHTFVTCFPIVRLDDLRKVETLNRESLDSAATERIVPMASAASMIGAGFFFGNSAMVGLKQSPRCTARPRRMLVVRAEGQTINPEIRKNEEKVVDAVIITELSKPLTAYCRCWRSGTFPLCDGSHVKHNKATGDNVGPLLLKKQ